MNLFLPKWCAFYVSLVASVFVIISVSNPCEKKNQIYNTSNKTCLVTIRKQKEKTNSSLSNHVFDTYFKVNSDQFVCFLLQNKRCKLYINSFVSPVLRFSFFFQLSQSMTKEADLSSSIKIKYEGISIKLIKLIKAIFKI